MLRNVDFSGKRHKKEAAEPYGTTRSAPGPVTDLWPTAVCF